MCKAGAVGALVILTIVQRVEWLSFVHLNLDVFLSCRNGILILVFGVSELYFLLLFPTLGLRPEVYHFLVEHVNIIAEVHIRVISVQLSILNVSISVYGSILSSRQDLLLLSLG